uniref:Putative terminase n=1 Tax=viral metagenome TaxID=1070528 RepID=A0A6M3KJF8_9ZZZZ
MAAEAIQLSLDYPNNRGYLCRQKLTDFRISTLLELKRYMEATVIIDDRGKQEVISLIAQHHQTENYFRLYNGSVIYYGGIGDDRDGTTRVKNMTLGFVGIDQVEEVEEVNFNWLCSRLRLILPNIHYKAILTANPAPGWVKRRFLESKMENHIFIPALPRDNPFLPDDYEDNLRKWFPPEMVKALLDGDWDALEGGNFLFKYNDLKKAINRELDITEEDTKWAGQDIAREGDDSSVFTVREGSNVLHMDEWGKTDLMETCGIIQVKMEKFGIAPENVNLDAVALGAGIYDRLRELKVMVNAIIAGGEPKDKEHYINIRAEMYDELRKRFEAGTISIPDDMDLIAQLSSIRFKIASDKKLQIISKEDMKRQYRLKSPDKADSLALCFYEPRIFTPDIRWL